MTAPANQYRDLANISPIERYRAVVNALGEGILVIAENGEILEANASAARILRIDPSTFRSIFSLLPGWRVRDERGREVQSDEFPASVTLRTGAACRNVIRQIERPDGTTLWLSINTEPLFQEGSSLPRAVVSSFHDISELKESHRQLSVREARLRRLLDAVPDLLFLLSTDGVFLDYRASRPELLFRRPEDFLGRKQTEVLPPEVAEACDRVLRKVVETGRIQSIEYSSDVLGTRQYFEARVTPFDTGTVLMIVRDITEARLAEQRLRQHEQERAHLARLGALGEMVAGISHEINQPLHAIANFAAASINKLESVDENAQEMVHQWLQKIASQAFRASEIVKRFRHFSSPAAHVSSVPVSELLQESAELVAGEFRRRNVQLEVRNAAGDAPFVADRIQLEQVLVNFLVNAGESLEGNEAKNRRVVVTAKIENGLLTCEVADNGAGLPDVPTAQLFDAFFTTKPNGLGLGLAISRTIVESQGGQIWVRANKPRGAVFGFSMPPASEPKGA